LPFEQFPKIRFQLPEEFQKIYLTHYKANREGSTSASSLAQKMEGWLHRQVAADVCQMRNKERTLELGAGTLNQLPYEPIVQVYDIVEPFDDLYKNSPHLSRIRKVYADITEVPSSHRYDRITSIATLEHLCELPTVIAHCGLFLDKNGVFRASIPNEGSFLWWLGWRLTTGLEFRLKYDLDYGLLMKYEHVNSAKEIEEVLNYFFSTVKCRVFGFSKSFSLYRYYECRFPRIDRCHGYLGVQA